MKSLGNILGVSLVLGLVAAMLYLFYRSGLFLWHHIDALPYDSKVILLATIGTLLMAVLLLVYGMRSAACIRARASLATRRHELYVHLLSTMRGLMDKNCGAGQREQLADQLAQAHADLLVLGNSSTIKAYLAFQQAYDGGEFELLEPSFQAVWKNMRKDLGYRDEFDLIDVRELIQILPRPLPAEQRNSSMLPG